MTCHIAFVHIGNNLPDYLSTAIRQASVFNNCSIILIASSQAVAGGGLPRFSNLHIITCESLGISQKHKTFHTLAPMDKTFRDGFWVYTTERFYYIETLMIKYGLSNVFHIENDNMLYVDLLSLLPIFQTYYNGIAATFDSPSRCVAGFLYIKDSTSISLFTQMINDYVANSNLPSNDMTLLSLFRHRFGSSYAGALPIVTGCYPLTLTNRVGCNPQPIGEYSTNFVEFKSVFDAAAIGQYLGGVDPKNSGGSDTVGFINETCIFDPSYFDYRWDIDQCNRRVPYLLSRGNPYRINNLHIHSKALGLFAS